MNPPEFFPSEPAAGHLWGGPAGPAWRRTAGLPIPASDGMEILDDLRRNRRPLNRLPIPLEILGGMGGTGGVEILDRRRIRRRSNRRTAGDLGRHGRVISIKIVRSSA